MTEFSSEISLIEKRISELMEYSACSYDKLLEAERYSMTAGGKHLRALIFLKTAEHYGVPIDKCIDYAVAVEMVHTYSLIHDDLPEMDNDDLRRGKPTCHKAFGSDIALLAGDALLTKAFNLISVDDKFDDSVKIKCIRILSDACGEHGMLAGQTIDKLSENAAVSLDRLYELQNRKTGDMFLCAVKIACVLSNAPQNDVDKLIEITKNLGLSFQIKDDILDVTSNVETLGKPINSDKDSNKSTFVSLLGKNRSEEILNELIEKSVVLSESLKFDFFKKLSFYFLNRDK